MCIDFFAILSHDHTQVKLAIAQVTYLASRFVLVSSLAAKKIPRLARARFTARIAAKLAEAHCFDVRELAVARIAIGKLMARLCGLANEQNRVRLVELVRFAFELELAAVDQQLLDVVELLSASLLLDGSLLLDVGLLEGRVESIVVQKQVREGLHLFLLLTWLASHR